MKSGFTRAASWTNLTSASLIRHGELMLSEQVALEDKKRVIGVMNREGLESPTRRVITANVKKRLKMEGLRDARCALDVHYDCASIRKNLAAMTNARRDLDNAKSQSRKILGEDEEQAAEAYREKLSFIQGLSPNNLH